MYFSLNLIENQQKKFSKFYDEYKSKNWNNQVNLNRLKKAKRNLDRFYNVVYENLKTNTPIYKIVSKHKYRTFYRTHKKIKNTFYSKNINLEKLLPKSTKPISTREFYTKDQIKYMQDLYYDPNNYQNKSSLWYELKHTIFPNLSFRIFVKYLNQDKRHLQDMKKAKINHPRRKKILPLGLIQMDVKVLDKHENPLKQKIYILDFIDEQSKFAYGEIIDQQKPNLIVDVIKNCKQYFLENGIQIKRVRTDNFMAFKKTNFVNSGLFRKYLESEGIKHEFIPKGEPQCNGVIERFHRTIKDEFCPKIRELTNINDIKKLLNFWFNFYNFNRYHYYNYEREYKSFDDHFMTPKQAIYDAEKLLKLKFS